MKGGFFGGIHKAGGMKKVYGGLKYKRAPSVCLQKIPKSWDYERGSMAENSTENS